jgi:hypothetical protein
VGCQKWQSSLYIPLIMAVYLNAYFKTSASQSQIEKSLTAQGWQFAVKPANAIATDYVIEQSLGFFLTVVEKKKMLKINDSTYPVEQYWSFRLDRNVDDDSEVYYTFIARLLGWLTATYKLQCCLTFDGESVEVIFDKGIEYIINDEAEYWTEYIQSVVRPGAVIRTESFDLL